MGNKDPILPSKYYKVFNILHQQRQRMIWFNYVKRFRLNAFLVKIYIHLRNNEKNILVIFFAIRKSAIAFLFLEIFQIHFVIVSLSFSSHSLHICYHQSHREINVCFYFSILYLMSSIPQEINFINVSFYGVNFPVD